MNTKRIDATREIAEEYEHGIDDELESTGDYVEVGEGRFSRVYLDNEETHVIKITSGDAGTTLFKDFREQYGYSKHWPVVHLDHNAGGDDWFIVMEVLEPLSPEEQDTWEMIEGGIDEMCNMIYRGENKLDMSPMSVFAAAVRLNGADFDWLAVRKEWLRMIKGNEEILQLAVDLYEYHQRMMAKGLDLHAENVMWRADGTLVITDPLAGSCW